MDGLLRDHEFADVFLNDILIASTTGDEHLRFFKAVLQRLDKAGLVIPTAKGEYGQNEIQFLGYKSKVRGSHHQLIGY